MVDLPKPDDPAARTKAALLGHPSTTRGQARSRCGPAPRATSSKANSSNGGPNQQQQAYQQAFLQLQGGSQQQQAYQQALLAASMPPVQQMPSSPYFQHSRPCNSSLPPCSSTTCSRPRSTPRSSPSTPHRQTGHLGLVLGINSRWLTILAQ
ncbi:hypothetical protein SEVIR_3G267401v4 [Setaria viridis]